MSHELLETYEKLKDALRVSVKLDSIEVFKIIINDLIQKRNSPTNKIKNKFDAVLLYYLGKEDFKKFVV